MDLARIHKALTRNAGAKIVALVFAVLLWFHVTAQQGEDQSFRVPLLLSGIPDSLTIVHDVPQFVEVTVRGPRSSLMKLRLIGRPKLTVDLSMARKGRINVPLAGSMLDLSDDFDPRDVSIDNPKALLLNFEKVITRSVPVRLAYKGKLPEDVMVLGSPVIIPARVQVRGAESIVSAIQFLTTQEIDIRGRRGKITEETGMTLEGRNVTVNPEKILVEMEIRKRGKRTLANIPPTLLQDDSEMSVEYLPKVVSLTIEGPEDVIEAVTADDVSVILNITTRKPGVYRLEPEVIVPAGVEKYFLDAEAFEITIFKEGEGRQDGPKSDG